MKKEPIVFVSKSRALSAQRRLEEHGLYARVSRWYNRGQIVGYVIRAQNGNILREV